MSEQWLVDGPRVIDVGASASSAPGTGANCSTRRIAVWVSPRLVRSASRSHTTLPEHMTTRVTAVPSRVAESGNTGRKVPVVKSCGIDEAALRRSIDFGVKTTSGRRGRA